MLKIQDIMTRDVLTLSPDLSIRETMEVLVARHVSGAPVVNGGEVVGVVSMTDLLEFAAALPQRELFDENEDTELATFDGELAIETDDDEDPNGAYFTELWDDDFDDVKARVDETTTSARSPLDSYRVSEAMTSAPVWALPPSASVDIAADLMRREKIHRVLVMSGSMLDGIITTTDIVNAVAEHKLGTRTYVFGAQSDFDSRVF